MAPYRQYGLLRPQNLAVCAVFRCCRPSLHRGANYLFQFLPIRAAGREDGHSVNDCGYKAGQCRWIAILRQIVLCLRLLEAAAQECHAGGPMCIQSLANRLRFVAAGNRAIDCQAAAGVAGTCLQTGGSPEELLCHFAGRRLPERRGDIACRSGCIALQSGAKQRLLVPECGIQTGPANAQGFRQVGNRSAFIAFRPEQAHRLLQRGIGIEFAGPTHCALFFPHPSNFLFHFRISSHRLNIYTGRYTM
jgi:hypothetical protein